MTEIRLDLTDGQTYDVTLGDVISDGGEGRVHEIAELPGYCAKIYRRPEKQPRLEDRLDELGRFGSGDWHLDDHPELAFPVGLCRDAGGTCIGFAMPRLAWPQVPLGEVLLPAKPLRKNGQLTWEHQIHFAADLARVVGKLHKAGVVVGDLCPDNIFVSLHDARITLVDVDSFQVLGRDGRRHPTRVLRPDYGAPELAGRPEGTWRSHLSDLTPLGIVIAEILLDRVHPFSGYPIGDEPRDGDDLDAYCIAAGLSWITDPHLVNPPRNAPDTLWILPPSMIELMTRCFSAGAGEPAKRPEADEWVRELTGLATGLQTCAENPWHRFRSGLGTCPWCGRARAVNLDPYPRPDKPGPTLNPWLTGAAGTSNRTRTMPRKKWITPTTTRAAESPVRPTVVEVPEVKPQTRLPVPRTPSSRPPSRTISTSRPARARNVDVPTPARTVPKSVPIDDPTLRSKPPRPRYRWITAVVWLLGLGMVAAVAYPVVVHYSDRAAAADGAADARKATATAMDGLLTRSVTGRASLLRALTDIGKCRINKKTRQEIVSATAARRALQTKVNAFDPSALPDGATVKAQLEVVLSRSVDADTAYLKWYDAAKGHCPKQSGKLFAAVGTANARAKAAKTLFLNSWNPIAADNGLPKRDVNSI